MVILALYDNGTLLEMQSLVYEGSEMSFTTNKAYNEAKVIVWDKLSGLKPICDVEFVK